MNPIPTLWYAVAALVLTNLLTLGAAGHYRNEAKLLAKDAEIAQRETTRVDKEQKRITQETTDGWKAAVDYLRAHPQRVLSRAGCPAVPQTAGGLNVPSADPVPAPERVEEDAAVTTLMLNQLQTWIEKQERVQ